MNEKELIILSHLRKDARKSLVDVAKDAQIPVSTVYDKVRKYEKSIIKKHTCIIDFQKIGYNIRAVLMLKAGNEGRFRKMIGSDPSINSVFKLHDQGYMIDCIFKYMAEMEDFMSRLEEHGIEERKMHFISEEIVRENFLTGCNDGKNSE